MVSIENTIFVVGTGRCGTSIVNSMLGRHSAIFSLPLEGRFIVDSDGLIDLCESLSTRYDFYRVDNAIKRFDYLMRMTLCGRVSNAFRLWKAGEFVGEERLKGALRSFYNELVIGCFDEVTGREYDEFPLPIDLGPSMRLVSRRIGDESKFMAAARRLIEGLFAEKMQIAKKGILCEKTPLSLLSLPFLRRLYPNCKILHVKRDPFDVVSSHLEQRWFPSSYGCVKELMMATYKRWFSLQKTYELQDDWYFEVKIEDLSRYERYVKRLFNFLDLKDEGCFRELDRQKPAKRTAINSDAVSARIVEDFSEVRARMGYGKMGRKVFRAE